MYGLKRMVTETWGCFDEHNADTLAGIDENYTQKSSSSLFV